MDDRKALKRYRLAADQGDRLAQYSLGNWHYYGQGLDQRTDYAKAAKWYRLAAEQGDAGAQTRLALIYSEGKGVIKDHVEAAKWCRLAAEQGNSEAQFKLSLMHAEGNGVPQDDILSHKWSNLAAATDDDMYSWALFRTASLHRAFIEEGMTREAVAEAQRLAREWKPKVWWDLRASARGF